MKVKDMFRALLFFSALNILCACTTIPVDERAEIRDEVDRVADEMITQMLADDPALQSEFDKSVGYAVGRISGTKMPFVGGGYGLALLHDTENDTRAYMNVTRFDLGAGLGIGRYRTLVIFESRNALERFRDGTWESGLGADSGVGALGTGTVLASGDGYSLYVKSESGAALTVTARLVKTSVNQDLTDNGISEVSIPNTGFKSIDDQGAAAPRVWDHALPFLAQDVIDKGYDLPLPYGIGLTYANVDQAQLLSSLQVGINGRPLQSLDFVEFENAVSSSDSFSVKADAWLFPFMNVFVMLGQVDGEATMDVLVEGNGLLDQLEINCSALPPSPLCALLQDQDFVLPIVAGFEGNTYGIGTTLAGGWNGWFVAIPFNWTYADMKDSRTDGINFTVTPRGGKIFNLGRNGNLALYVGGNYLDSDLTVDGFYATPDGQLEFDYIIDQENKDKWNALLGFNWDINRRLSWSAEYDGFVGSRDAFITSINWKW